MTLYYLFPPLICTLIRKSQAPCKIYPIFPDLPYETQLFLRLPPQKISGAFATLKKRVDFTERLRFSIQGAD